MSLGLPDPPFLFVGDARIYLVEDRIYWVKKLGLTMDEYERVMAEKPTFYTDYPNSEKLYHRLRDVARAGAKVYRTVRPRK